MHAAIEHGRLPSSIVHLHLKGVIVHGDVMPPIGVSEDRQAHGFTLRCFSRQKPGAFHRFAILRAIRFGTAREEPPVSGTIAILEKSA